MSALNDRVDEMIQEKQYEAMEFTAQRERIRLSQADLELEYYKTWQTRQTKLAEIELETAKQRLANEKLVGKILERMAEEGGSINFKMS